MKRIGLILILAITVMAFVACPTVSNIAVTGVTLNKTNTTITVGATEQLTATVAPADATDKNVVWTSSDATKATVSTSGLVTAVATAVAGTATITVTTVDGSFKATCIVTVHIPDYVGAWSGPAPWGTGSPTLTMTFTATTTHWAIVGGSYDGSTADASMVVDETAKHMTWTFASVTGALTGDISVGIPYYDTYAVSGTTLQIAVASQSSFPQNATGGLTLTKP